ncbi:MAG: hypothetical protein ACFNYC_07350, partial [Porphyromonas endodontalis]
MARMPSRWLVSLIRVWLTSRGWGCCIPLLRITDWNLYERVLRVPVFFAKPYCSTDKPHAELLNKLIRQYIPKGTSFKDINDKQIRNIRMLLN